MSQRFILLLSDNVCVSLSDQMFINDPELGNRVPEMRVPKYGFKRGRGNFLVNAINGWN